MKKHFLKKKKIPVWLGLCLMATAIFGLVLAAYKSGELEYLRQEVRTYERARSVSVNTDSILMSRELCRKNWLKRAQNWIAGIDICDY